MESRRERQLENPTEEIWAGLLDTRRDAGAHPQGVVLLPWETGIAFCISTPSQSGGNEPHKPRVIEPLRLEKKTFYLIEFNHQDLSHWSIQNF